MVSETSLQDPRKGPLNPEASLPQAVLGLLLQPKPPKWVSDQSVGSEVGEHPVSLSNMIINGGRVQADQAKAERRVSLGLCVHTEAAGVQEESERPVYSQSRVRSMTHPPLM